MPISWSGNLIVLSVLIAMFGSFTALSHAERMRESTGYQAAAWMIAGGVTLGMAVWSMHFIGMLAFHLPIPIAYDSWLTFISVLPVIAAALLGFYLLRSPKLQLKKIVIGGFFMGLGITAMHYTGMAALRMQPAISYNPTIFALSVVVAITAAIGALLIVYAGEKTGLHPLIQHLLGAVIMGFAIAGMHYTAMAGAIFAPSSICLVGGLQIEPNLLALIVTSGCFLLFSGGGFANSLDRHMALDNVRLAHAQLEANQKELRIAASAFEVQEGVMITDANNVILRVNKSFTQLTGYSTEEVLGKTTAMLISERHDEQYYQDILQALRQDKSWAGEVWSKRKDEVINPYRLTITAVSNPDGQVTNFVAAISDIREFKEAQESILLLAFHDPLTQLPNRRLLQDRLQQAIAGSIRSRRYGAIMFIDLDHFKELNDTLGHDFGDMLLVEVAYRLQDCVREGDTVTRLGGDEFVVMLEDLSEDAKRATTEVKTVGKKISAIINQPYFLQTNECHITSSIGISLFCGNVNSVDDLLKQADIAMYKAKNSGRNAMRFFKSSMKKNLESNAPLNLNS
ncbi:MAG TPA: diguanylate cyclase [Methylotenera sp.]|nr:diguanylate cyclase [Methylotenera sp.]